MFNRTAQDELEHYWYVDRIGLMGPESLGEPIAGRPAVVTVSLYGVHMLVRGSDDGLLRRRNTRPLQRARMGPVDVGLNREALNCSDVDW